MLQVIVGGFPNSGTSFLCHLVSEMGFSPGSAKNLKGADAHNRWGYWEHLPIRAHSWSLFGGRFQPEHNLPNLPYPRNDDVASAIESLAIIDNVEVYKDNAIPLVYRSFPPEAKYVLMTRKPRNCYDSPKKAGRKGYSCSYKVFLEGFSKYHLLADVMRRDVDTLLIGYEAFERDLEGSVDKVASFLGVALDNPEEVYGIFRPRG